MAENTKIEWAHHTFNPWMGCQKVSPACDHCYAEVNTAVRTLGVQWGAAAERRRTSDANWKLPKRWNAEAERLGIRYRVFCASLADVFDNAAPAEWRADLFKLIVETPNLDWLLLTKRIGNAREMMEIACTPWRIAGCAWPLPNVWIGATICNQEEADRDIPKLLAVPAAKRFLSMEPLLGPVSLRWLPAWPENAPTKAMNPAGNTNEYDGLRRLDWVIVGGESGHYARPMHPDWARSLRDQCQAAGVPYMFKQWGEYTAWTGAESPSPSCRMDDMTPMVRVGKKAAGRMLDGRTWDEVPV